ncbi:hypothetical protein ACFXJO_22050, partial [Streptomyces lavendulae]
AAAAGAEVPEEAYEELAGSAAGVGREHPGRPAAEPPAAEFAAAPHAAHPARPRPQRPEPAASPYLPPGATPDPARNPSRTSPRTPPRTSSHSPGPGHPSASAAIGTEANGRAADLAAHMLPLGTGLALMGLGLGYMGVRLRQGR